MKDSPMPKTWKGFPMTDSGTVRVTLVGATGRMGREVARLLGAKPDIKLVSAIASPSSPALGKKLREAGVCDLDLEVQSPLALPEAARNSDAIISFTKPQAELANLTAISEQNIPLVIGTTGFTEEQMRTLKESVKNSPVVYSSNFSIGANLLFHLTHELALLPEEFEFSIIEEHHSGKSDSPSGTAKRLSEILMEERGYTKIVSGRSGDSRRRPDELEVFSVRAGGIAGRHSVIAAGQHEMITIGHDAFTRAAFAGGVLSATRWVVGRGPGFYTMKDVLGLK